LFDPTELARTNPRYSNISSTHYERAIETEVSRLTSTGPVRCAFFEGDLRSRSAIEFLAFAPLKASKCVAIDIPLGCSFLSGVHSSRVFIPLGCSLLTLFLPVGTVHCVHTLKVNGSASEEADEREDDEEEWGVDYVVVLLNGIPVSDAELAGAAGDRAAAQATAVQRLVVETLGVDLYILSGFDSANPGTGGAGGSSYTVPNWAKQPVVVVSLPYSTTMLGGGLGQSVQVVTASFDSTGQINPALSGVRCAFSDRHLHSRMPLDPTHVRLKRTWV
jgi:hypothetical protein